MSLKENQSGLYEDTVYGFKACAYQSVLEQWEYDHGRFKIRKCSIINAQDALLPERWEQWSGLKTLIRVESSRITKDRQMKETRYYISDEQGMNAAYLTL